MKYFEYGKANDELLVMLHGGGVSYRGAVPLAEYLANFYHVILVAYDGFNPSEPDTEFKSTTYEALKLGNYLVAHYDGKVDILYGVSYGTFVLMDVLADKRLIIATTIADGMPTMDYPDIKNPILKRLFLFFFTGFAYQLIGKAGPIPIRKRIVCKMMGRSEAALDKLIYRDASWQSWYNQDACMIGRHRDFDLFKRSDLYVWHGIKSATERKLAKNMQEWTDKGYAFTYKIFSNMGHGSLAGEHWEQFAQELAMAHQETLKKRAREEKMIR